MELLDGETLAHRFERKARSLVIEESPCSLPTQVLDRAGVGARREGSVHRDIKPDNDLFDPRRRGEAARLRHRAHSRILGAAHEQHAIGIHHGDAGVHGTRQARARLDEVDARTDLWRSAATMFKLLTVAWSTWRRP